MTEKEKIREEFSTRLKEAKKALGICPSSAIGGMVQAYENVLSYIDSIPEQPVGEDLEKEIESLWNLWTTSETPMYDKPEPDAMILINKSNFDYIARHFTNWQKGQMMKEAVDAEIGYSSIKTDDICKFRIGDKVKLIIIKED